MIINNFFHAAPGLGLLPTGAPGHAGGVAPDAVAIGTDHTAQLALTATAVGQAELDVLAIESYPGKAQLGRATGDILIPDKKISSLHAQVEKDSSGNLMAENHYP